MAGIFFGIRLFLVLSLLVFVPGSRAQIIYGHQKCNENLMLKEATMAVNDYQKWSNVFPNVNENTDVIIPCGTAVYMDTASSLNMSSLHVDGLLLVPMDLGLITLRTRNVLVTGKLKIVGPPDNRRGKVDIILDNMGKGPGNLMIPINKLNRIGGVDGEPNAPYSAGDRAFAVIGGQVDLQGTTTHCANFAHGLLLNTVYPGATKILMTGRFPAACWRDGFSLAIAPSGYERAEHEVRKIIRRRSIGRQIEFELDAPLKFTHYGQSEDFFTEGRKVSMPAEVILLNRPLTIQGSHEYNENYFGHGRYRGAHFMIANTAMKQNLLGVEFKNMGQLGSLGRYPLHFHFCGETEQSVINGCSVHDSHQRGIVIHGTRNVLVSDNTLHNIRGHGILSGEDGWEENNQFIRNVGIYFERVPFRLQLPESSDAFPSGLWITNPKNIFIGNRMVGSMFSGIWFEMDHRVNRASLGLRGAAEMRPMVMVIDTFVDNVVHSNGEMGIRLYPGRFEPAGRNYLDGLVSYKNGQYGIFLHAGVGAEFRNAVIVDNLGGAIDYDRQIESMVRDSVIIGKSHLGGRCPSKLSVEFHVMRALAINKANAMVNVVFDGFKGCGPLIGVDGDDRISKDDPFSSSTKIENCTFVDTTPTQTFSFKSAVDSKYQFAEYIALAIRNTRFIDTTYQDSFALSRTRFMAALGKPCSRFQHGIFCSNVCYRSVGLTISGIDRNVAYQLRLHRIRIGRHVTIKPVIYHLGVYRWTFWAPLQTGETYRFELIVPDGAAQPERMAFEFADSTDSCQLGDLSFRLIHNGFALGAPAPFRQNPALYNTCPGMAARKIAYYYPMCRGNNKAERAFVIPAGAFTEDIAPFRRGIHMRTSPTPTYCDARKMCEAFPSHSLWNYQGDIRSAWAEGPTPIGYGLDEGIFTSVPNSPVSIRLRKVINVKGDPSCYARRMAEARLRYGHGVVMKLNGAEIYRDHVRKGENAQTTAIKHQGQFMYRWSPMTALNMRGMKSGDNVLEVTVHNAFVGRGRILFDMQLFFNTNSC